MTDDTSDLATPDLLVDPYPTYHRLRREAPVYRRPQGIWYLTRFADVAQILTDPRFRRRPPAGCSLFEPRPLKPNPVDRMVRQWMLFLDPPVHTWLRRVFDQALAPRSVKAMRPHIESTVEDLLEPLWDGGSMEVIADLAYPLPVSVISELLGVPAEDRELLKNASRDLTKALGSGAEREMIAAAPAGAELMAYFRDIVTERRKRPKDDVISALIAADYQGRRLTDSAILANCVMLLFAGHETTKNLIGNGLLILLRYPQQLDALRRDPGKIKSAVEEFLRFESPIQRTFRWTAEAVEIGGTRIGPGQLVVGIIGAANRDPARFDDPDEPKIDRRDNGHLAFGRGIHNCLGGLLARIEAQSAIGTLLNRTRRWELQIDEIEWQQNMSFRGPESLPVSFETV